MGYKFLEHESDLYIEGCDSDLYSALQQIGKAVIQTLNERENTNTYSKNNLSKTSKTSKTLKLMISDEDEKSFVVRVFSEIISEIEAEEIKPISISILKSALVSTSANANTNIFSATIIIEGYVGVPANIIKAVTWHDLDIKHRDKQTCVRILFDI